MQRQVVAIEKKHALLIFAFEIINKIKNPIKNIDAHNITDKNLNNTYFCMTNYLIQESLTPYKFLVYNTRSVSFRVALNVITILQCNNH